MTWLLRDIFNKVILNPPIILIYKNLNHKKAYIKSVGYYINTLDINMEFYILEIRDVALRGFININIFYF